MVRGAELDADTHSKEISCSLAIWALEANVDEVFLRSGDGTKVNLTAFVQNSDLVEKLHVMKSVTADSPGYGRVSAHIVDILRSLINSNHCSCTLIAAG